MDLILVDRAAQDPQVSSGLAIGNTYVLAICPRRIDTLVLSGYKVPGWLEGALLDHIGTAERPQLGSCLVDQLRKRHGSLVDKKFLDGLSESERTELERVNRLLNAAEASYYAPIKDALARAGATLLERT